MKLSQGVEWAMHTVLLLSQVPEGQYCCRRTIAEYYALPEPYLAKYLKKLVTAGILTAISGPRGGYRLAAPATDIRTLDVFLAIEGSAPAFTCTDLRRQGLGAATEEECERKCVVHALMDRADQAFRAELASTTVADLGALLPETVLARARKAVAR